MAGKKPVGSLPASEQIKRDFKLYWEAAEKGRLEDPDKQREILVSAHRYAACFSQLSRAAATLDSNRRIFLQEMASDSIHLVHVLMGGDARGASFYMRSIIENFWRHHYFRDHPVEYGWLHTRAKYYVEMKNLREHCGWLDCFSGKIRPLLDDLGRLYSDLSSSVHSTSSKTLVLRGTLEDIRLSKEQGESIKKNLHSVMRANVGLLMFSERDIVGGLHVNFQDLLLRLLTASQKRWLQADLDGLVDA